MQHTKPDPHGTPSGMIAGSALKGERTGHWSIRVNDQKWRICFVWNDGNANEVEIVDITDSRNDMTRLKNIHPGEILLEEFLAPMEISQNALARGIAVPPRRINEIVLSKRAVTADSQGITQGVQAKGVLLASHGYSP